jgi:hypothetical protein
MRKLVVACGRRGRVLLVDSITQLEPADAGAIVVAGSHGGTSSGEIALGTALAAVFFNDAGIGKDSAGIAALVMLQQRGIAAGAVSHRSARIGDALDAWETGVISALNDAARSRGLRVDEPLQVQLRVWCE